MRKNRECGLDIIRVFSLLAVILVHLGQSEFCPSMLSKYSSWGAHGVQLFFILSAFLAVKSYNYHYKNNVKEYYLSRAIRILPSYYCEILICMLMYHLLNMDVPEDVFHLGWSRYFLGINMILPSNSFYIWNNINGWWTMSAFILFYVSVPFLCKVINNFKASVIFMFFTFGLREISQLAYHKIFGGLDSLDLFVEYTFFSVLFQFSIGLMLYYSIEENKRNVFNLLCIAFCMVAAIFNKELFLWCGIGGLLILNVQGVFKFGGHKWIAWGANQSYYLYLVHLMGINIATKLAKEIVNCSNNTLEFFIIWIVISAVSCLILNIVDRIVKYKFRS